MPARLAFSHHECAASLDCSLGNGLTVQRVKRVEWKLLLHASTLMLCVNGAREHSSNSASAVCSPAAFVCCGQGARMS